jgi:hypothetical protein
VERYIVLAHSRCAAKVFDCLLGYWNCNSLRAYFRSEARYGRIDEVGEIHFNLAVEETIEETDNLLHNAHVPVQKYAWREIYYYLNKFNLLRFKSSFFPFALHWAFALTLLSLWTIITFLLPVPGCQRGYIGPGGLADYSEHYNCTGTFGIFSTPHFPLSLSLSYLSSLTLPNEFQIGGAALYIDKMVFGENHIFASPTCKEMYHTGSASSSPTISPFNLFSFSTIQRVCWAISPLSSSASWGSLQAVYCRSTQCISSESPYGLGGALCFAHLLHFCAK